MKVGWGTKCTKGESCASSSRLSERANYIACFTHHHLRNLQYFLPVCYTGYLFWSMWWKQRWTSCVSCGIVCLKKINFRREIWNFMRKKSKQNKLVDCFVIELDLFMEITTKSSQVHAAEQRRSAEFSPYYLDVVLFLCCFFILDCFANPRRRTKDPYHFCRSCTRQCS